MSRVRALAAQHTRAVQILGFSVGYLALATFLWPITRTWYLGDDAYVAFYADAVALRGDSRIGYIFDEIGRAADELGRFAPLGFVTNYAYSVTPSIFVFKIWVIVVTLVSVALAAELLRQLGFGWPYAALLPVALCAFIQLRYWHDPLLAYGAGMPIVACLMLGSLVVFAQALRQGRWWLHATAIGLFIAGCLYWEGTAFLMPLVIPVAWVIDGRCLGAIVRRTAPFAVASAAFVLAILVLRAAAPAQGTVVNLYQPNLAPRAIASGLAKQISGGVPLSYLLAVARAPDSSDALPPENATALYGAASAGQAVPPGFVASERALILDSLRRPHAVLVLALVLLGLTVALPPVARTRVSARSILAAGALGMWLVIGAALPLAISARWQRETFWGVSYIPVFLEYLGLAMVAVALLAFAYRALSGRRGASAALSVGLATAIVACATATNALNERVVQAFDGVKVAMSFNDDALGAGLLRSLGPSKELLLDETVPLSPWFLSVAGRTPVPPTHSLADFASRFAGCRTSETTWCPGSVSRVAYVSRLDLQSMPWAAVCRVDNSASRLAGATMCGSRIVVAVGEDRASGERCGQLVLDAEQRRDLHPSSQPPVFLRRISASNDVAFCEARFQAPVLVQSIAVSDRREPAEGQLRIVATNPTAARVGVPFNVQPDGQSAIGVTAVGITPTTRVVMNGVDLPSRYVDSHLITALVAGTFIAQPGRLEVRLRDRGVTSDAQSFEVNP